MSLDTTLKKLFDVIRDEAKQNATFRDRLEQLLGTAHLSSQISAVPSTIKSATQRRGNRRAPALVDPIADGDGGEVHVRERLAPLTLEQLRDVVADFRMDPTKLVMKWKDRQRVIDHIVSTAVGRRQKGDAFRG
jgi:hypothetical protein